MSQKERQRHHLLQMVLDGKNTLKDAGKRMGVSYRHAKRLKKKLITEGAKGLIHGNRGRPSPKALNRELAERIIELSQNKYTNFNDTHFTEKLNEIEGITVGRDTVRRLRRTNGIKPKRRPRSPQVREQHDFQGGRLDSFECEGCGVCVYFCPEKVIDFPVKTCGQWFRSDTRFGPMIHARLGIAEENSGKFVTLLRQEASRLTRLL